MSERKATWSIGLECKLRDLWVGAYWETIDTMISSSFHLWICIVPCLPVHITRRVSGIHRW